MHKNWSGERFILCCMLIILLSEYLTEKNVAIEQRSNHFLPWLIRQSGISH